MDLAEGNAAFVSPRNLATWLVRLEIPVLSVIYVYFVISDTVPLFAFGLVGLIWLARWWTTGRLIERTPLDLPILILVALLPLSLAVTTEPWTTWPKVYGALLGVAFFYAVAAQIDSRQDLASASFWWVLVCVAISMAGLIGTDWAQSKIVSASFIYDRLPHIIQGIPRSIAGGFARNGVGGTMTLVVPLLAGLVFAGGWTTGDKSIHGKAAGLETTTSGLAIAKTPTRFRLDEVWISRSVWFALVFSLFVLALTQSRGGILGSAVGILAVAIWRQRRLAWIILVGVLVLAGILLAGQGNTLAEFLLRMDAQNGTLASRLEVWQRGVMMVQDFPFTGIGLGTFDSVAHSMYPFFIAAPDELVAHAHNNLLEVAVDVGLPGLIAYVALLTGFAYCIIRAYRGVEDTAVRALLAGLGAAILAHQVFGLTDAFILGTKPGVIVWVYLALAAILYTHRTVWQVAGIGDKE